MDKSLFKNRDTRHILDGLDTNVGFFIIRLSHNKFYIYSRNINPYGYLVVFKDSTPGVIDFNQYGYVSKGLVTDDQTVYMILRSLSGVRYHDCYKERLKEKYIKEIQKNYGC